MSIVALVLRNGMCFPPCVGFVWLLVGSHAMKHSHSYERGVMVAETKDEMNEVGRRTQVAARTKAVGVARSVTNCVVQRSTRRAMQVCQYYKVHKWLYWHCCIGLAQLLADDCCRETLLPCSVGVVQALGIRFCAVGKRSLAES